MTACYICEEVLNDTNLSVEHIIPNAIGGRLKSKNLLCIKCNSELGEQADAELSKTFNHIMLRHEIRRARGLPPPTKATNVDTGENVILCPNNTYKLHEPKIELKLADEIIKGIRISHPDKRRIENELARILKVLPEINDFKNIKYSQTNLPPIKSEHHINADLDLLSVSLAKIAVNYFLHLGGEKETVANVINFIQGKGRNEFVFNYGTNIFKLSPNNQEEVIHILSLKGDRQSQKLIAFIQLFSESSVLILLNNEYNGDNFNTTYNHNLLTDKETQDDSALQLDFSYLAVDQLLKN